LAAKQPATVKGSRARFIEFHAEISIVAPPISRKTPAENSAKACALKEFVFTGKWGNPAPFLVKR
jgi:hypothetical protein